MKNNDAQRRRVTTNNSLRLAGLVLAVIVCAHPAALITVLGSEADPPPDADQRDVLLREYAKHSEKIRDYYNNLLIRGKTIRYLPLNAQAFRQQFENAKNGEKLDIPISTVSSCLKARNGFLHHTFP